MKDCKNRLRMTKAYSGCSAGPCPTVYETNTGELVIQGYKIIGRDRADATVPAHEDIVRIPRELIEEYLRRSGE